MAGGSTKLLLWPVVNQVSWTQYCNASSQVARPNRPFQFQQWDGRCTARLGPPTEQKGKTQTEIRLQPGVGEDGDRPCRRTFAISSRALPVLSVAILLPSAVCDCLFPLLRARFPIIAPALGAPSFGERALPLQRPRHVPETLVKALLDHLPAVRFASKDQ